MGSVKLIKPFLQKYKFYLIFYIICILLTYPLESVLIPETFSKLFESIRDNNFNISNNIFLNFYKKIGLFMLVTTIAHKIISHLDVFLMPECNELVQNIFFEKILKYFENNYTDLELGKILIRINGLPNILKEITSDLFTWIIPKILTLVAINYYFFINDKILGIISISMLFLIFYINYKSFNKCINIAHNKYEKYEEKSELLQDKLSNLYSIYSSGNINEEIQNFNDITKEYKLVHKESIKCSNNLKNINNSLSTLILFLLSIYITYIFKTNKITKQKLIALFMILLFYIPCLSTIITYLPDYTTHLGTIKSLDEFIDNIHKTQKIKPNINISEGNIIIKNLTFGYNNKNLIFNNFNLNINTKEKIAIIGTSGNGKSTLIKLIMGYFEVPDNTIFIDNQDINKYNLNSIRKQITYINQNTKLFNKTIFENIKYGNNSTNDDIITLFNTFKLNKIFVNLPDGFNTKVGVNGDSISGGQKQIILLLRNYFNKNNILILDEPTSALDIETCNIVINIIKKISENATLIIITHDDNNFELINRKIKLDNGKIILDVTS